MPLAAAALALAAALPVCRAQTAVDAPAEAPAPPVESNRAGINPFRISGYGTLGVTYADAPDGWGFRRTIFQPANDSGLRADVDSRFGLQVNYSPMAQVELVGQVLAMRRGPAAEASDSIEKLFASYRPTADLLLRAGRVDIEQFLLSDYRHVGFAYRFVRPPIDFYGALPSSMDGIDAAQSWQWGDANYRLRFGVGRAYHGDMSKDARIDVSPVYGLVLSREADGLMIRLGLSRARASSEPKSLEPLLTGLSQVAQVPVPSVAQEAAALYDRVSLNGRQVTYATLALNYESSTWEWTAEAARATSGSKYRVTSGYANVGRRFGSVLVHGGFAGTWDSAPVVATPNWAPTLLPLAGPVVAAQAQVAGTAAAMVANGGYDQRTLTLGLRWDFHEQMALKLQFDHVRTSQMGGELWSPSKPEAMHANVGSIALDFIF